MHIGILGAGQLARMMALAGLPMGLEFSFLDPNPDACAGQFGHLVTADWADACALDRLAGCDRITCDFENVPADSLARLAAATEVRPCAAALAAAQDRLEEKRLFTALGMDVPNFAAVDTRPDLLAAIEQIGLPAVLKTRRFGYDGKGQAVLRTQEDLEPAWQRLGGQPLILEALIEFRFEAAITAVRSAQGQLRCYPLSRTVHHQGILQFAQAPAPFDRQHQAESMVRALADHLDYVGCLTLELFVTDQGLLANEFAPRVHNSAHWTIEGAETSQFENHLRALCDWPLGSTTLRGPALMVNWIGQMPEPATFMAIDGLAWHDYAKSARAGRKVGHATLTANHTAELAARCERLTTVLPDQLKTCLASMMASSG